ncbi:MAG: glycerol-3-phosphate 1-O-acyltransferase PlsY [Pseudomonadota bacterium]
MLLWLLVPFAYLLGSISSAILVSRAFALPDPRQQGSKNPGATNVLRLGGRKAAILTLAGDAGKGLIPVLTAHALHADDMIVAATGLAAFIGHLYPVFFGFKGGKGVATSLGVLLGFSWALGLSALLTWITVAALFRISSLAAIVAALLTPVFAWHWTASVPVTLACNGLAVLLLWRHRENMQRLARGEEKKLGR